jgi:hypothetical protein
MSRPGTLEERLRRGARGSVRGDVRGGGAKHERLRHEDEGGGDSEDCAHCCVGVAR